MDVDSRRCVVAAIEARPAPARGFAQAPGRLDRRRIREFGSGRHAVLGQGPPALGANFQTGLDRFPAMRASPLCLV